MLEAQTINTIDVDINNDEIKDLQTNLKQAILEDLKDNKNNNKTNENKPATNITEDEKTQATEKAKNTTSSLKKFENQEQKIKTLTNMPFLVFVNQNDKIFAIYNKEQKPEKYTITYLTTKETFNTMKKPYPDILAGQFINVQDNIDNLYQNTLLYTNTEPKDLVYNGIGLGTTIPENNDDKKSLINKILNTKFVSNIAHVQNKNDNDVFLLNTPYILNTEAFFIDVNLDLQCIYQRKIQDILKSIQSKVQNMCKNTSFVHDIITKASDVVRSPIDDQKYNTIIDYLRTFKNNETNQSHKPLTEQEYQHISNFLECCLSSVCGFPKWFQGPHVRCSPQQLLSSIFCLCIHNENLQAVNSFSFYEEMCELTKIQDIFTQLATKSKKYDEIIKEHSKTIEQSCEKYKTDHKLDWVNAYSFEDCYKIVSKNKDALQSIKSEYDEKMKDIDDLIKNNQDVLKDTSPLIKKQFKTELGLFGTFGKYYIDTNTLTYPMTDDLFECFSISFKDDYQIKDVCIKYKKQNNQKDIHLNPFLDVPVISQKNPNKNNKTIPLLKTFCPHVGVILQTSMI